jgi:hypothetical protein
MQTRLPKPSIYYNSSHIFCYYKAPLTLFPKMPLKGLLGSSRDQPYAASDSRNPKNYCKVVHDKRKVDEAAQGRRMSEAYAAGKLKRSYY